MATTTAPASGRKAQAARNDTAILEAARAVFVADPGAPISAVAVRAGVGISALYRRYPSKEELLRKLCGDGLKAHIAAAEAALADDRDAFKVFRAFMHRVVEADTRTLTAKLAGTLERTSEGLWRDATKAQDLSERVFKRAQKAGAVRADAVAEDMTAVFEQLTAVRGPTEKRTAELRKRYLTLQLEGLRPRKKAHQLPGPPPTAKDGFRSA
jgi:AcrR family transcriptional regulator